MEEKEEEQQEADDIIKALVSDVSDGNETEHVPFYHSECRS